MADLLKPGCICAHKAEDHRKDGCVVGRRVVWVAGPDGRMAGPPDDSRRCRCRWDGVFPIGGAATSPAPSAADFFASDAQTRHVELEAETLAECAASGSPPRQWEIAQAVRAKEGAERPAREVGATPVPLDERTVRRWAREEAEGALRTFVGLPASSTPAKCEESERDVMADNEALRARVKELADANLTLVGEELAATERAEKAEAERDAALIVTLRRTSAALTRLAKQRDEAIRIALELVDDMALDETQELIDRSYGRNKEAAAEQKEIIDRRGFDWTAMSYEDARAALRALDGEP